jgi:pyruvate/2-oxoglutarate dehydrogenase complex dihydrolipoamide dehydrogenase (E3) component
VTERWRRLHEPDNFSTFVSSPLIEQKDEVIHGYRKKKYESLTGGQFTIERGQVQFVDDHSVQVDGKRITGEKDDQVSPYQVITKRSFDR